MKVTITFDTGEKKEVSMLEAYIRYSLGMLDIKSIKFEENETK